MAFAASCRLFQNVNILKSKTRQGTASSAYLRLWNRQRQGSLPPFARVIPDCARANRLTPATRNASFVADKSWTNQTAASKSETLLGESIDSTVI
jgi:hypothetical protein